MSQYGLSQVYDGKDAKVDIVFIHGLRGDMNQTWTKDGVLWPEKLLPKDIPESRIYLFGYDSGITHRNQASVSKTEIHGDAEDLCAQLEAARSSTKTENRPIVCVAHSLGGLIAAQALVHGERRPETSGAKAISKNIRGMLFLGTPFGGASSAKAAESARKFMQALGCDTQEQTLKLLGVDSERLDELRRAFVDVMTNRRDSKKADESIAVFFFYETLKTSFKVGSFQVVKEDSAQIMGIGDAVPIHADHHTICKFASAQEDGYTKISASIRKAMSTTQGDSSEATSVVNNYGNAANVGQHITVGKQANNVGPQTNLW